MPLNTSDSVYRRDEPKGIVEPATPENPLHAVNTSAVLEPPQMVYTDEEPEILAAVSATGWYASTTDGSRIPLVLWAVWDDGAVTGVVVGDGGRIDATQSVESMPHFEKYTNDNDNSKEA